MQFSSYETGGFYDEMFEETAARGRTPAAAGDHRIAVRWPAAALQARRRAAAAPDGHHLQRLRRFGRRRAHLSLRPGPAHRRRPTSGTWIERGLKQRIHALNAFIDDIYHEQKILKDGVIPREVILSAASYRQQCHGLESALGRLVPHHRNRPGARPRRPVSTCSKTTCACPRASPTCWKTARC